MDAEAFHRAADVPTITAQTLPRGRALSSGELRALFESCADGTKAGVRDAALMAILYAGGLRRSEAVGLDFSEQEVSRSPHRVPQEEGDVRIRFRDGKLTALLRKDHPAVFSKGESDRWYRAEIPIP
jgi:integrase